MSKKYSFYSKETGLFLPYGLEGSKSMATANTPDGYVAIDGNYNHLSQRIDLDVLKQVEHLEYELGESLRPGNNDYFVDQIADLKKRLVIDYQPPSPGDDHEWNTDTKRWQVKPDIAKKRQTIASAQAEIDSLERAQLRAVRELAINKANDEALKKLQSIDDQIALQRQLIALNK